MLLGAGDAGGVINSALANGANVGVTASWELENDGDHNVNGGDVADWVTPKGAAALYEVKVDVTAGAFSTGTTGSWLALTTTRTWTKSVAGAVTFTVSFREAGTGEIRSTQAGVTLTFV